MGIIVWLVILVVIVANGWNTALWIFLALSGLLLVAAVSGGGRKQAGGRPAGNGRTASRRIDRPHYIDLDEHECPKCGARFRLNTMVCPGCGTKFTGTVEDDEAFIEEMELWDDDD